MKERDYYPQNLPPESKFSKETLEFLDKSIEIHLKNAEKLMHPEPNSMFVKNDYWISTISDLKDSLRRRYGKDEKEWPEKMVNAVQKIEEAYNLEGAIDRTIMIGMDMLNKKLENNEPLSTIIEFIKLLKHDLAIRYGKDEKKWPLSVKKLLKTASEKINSYPPEASADGILEIESLAEYNPDEERKAA